MSDDRFRRPNPERTHPMRRWQAAQRSAESWQANPPTEAAPPDAEPSSNESASNSESPEAPPTSAGEDPFKEGAYGSGPTQPPPWQDSVSRGVELGYQVVEEQIRLGQDMARQFGIGFPPGTTPGDDPWNILRRALRYSEDMAGLVFQFLGSMAQGGGGVPPFWGAPNPGWPPGQRPQQGYPGGGNPPQGDLWDQGSPWGPGAPWAQTNPWAQGPWNQTPWGNNSWTESPSTERSSANAETPPRPHEGEAATSSPWRANASSKRAGPQPYNDAAAQTLMVEVRSHRPTRTRLELTPDAMVRPLSCPGLYANDSEARLDDVRFSSETPSCLIIRVPQDQPDGQYQGSILDQEWGTPLGCVSLQIGIDSSERTFPRAVAFDAGSE